MDEYWKYISHKKTLEWRIAKRIVEKHDSVIMSVRNTSRGEDEIGENIHIMLSESEVALNEAYNEFEEALNRLVDNLLQISEGSQSSSLSQKSLRSEKQ